ncbi:MAG: hypothetical protein RL136_2517 [Planctomycetota bacterium]|jgi:hypothetical protein
MNAPQHQPLPRFRGFARSVGRVVAIGTALVCLGLLARGVQTSCEIAGHGVEVASPEGLGAGAAVIGSIRDGARYTADFLSVPAMLAIGALAAVALGSVMVILRSRSDKAGATFFALAVFAALTLSRSEARAMLDDSNHDAWHLAARVGLALGACLLAWRWIEDVALAASMLPSDDPHEVDPLADREAQHIATHGPMHTDANSRRLRDALRTDSIREEPEPGLHGRGSPIPRVMPAQDAPLVSMD